MWVTLAAALMVWAVVAPPSRRHLARLQLKARAEAKPVAVASPVVVAVVAGLLAFGLSGGLAWGIAASAAMLTSVLLLHRYRRRRAARLLESEVSQAVKLLATLLRSGQIPTAALEEAAADFAVLEQASAVSKLGGDVAGALAARSQEAGGAGLGTLAAAWRVSERSGAPIAAVLERVADSLRKERRIREIVDTELASARASGQMMALLPFGAVGLGAFAGVNSLAFLFGTPIGAWLFCGAVVLTGCGVLWIDRLSAR